MRNLTTWDLTQPLTLLHLKKRDDGEGGWREEWIKGASLWGALWPLINKNDPDGAYYRLTIRRGIDLPPKAGFLWHLYHRSKRLLITNAPILIQSNQFLSMTVKEDFHA